MSSLAALLFLACAPKPVEVEEIVEETVSETGTLLSEQVMDDGIVEQLIDLNGDRKPDVYNYYREREGAPRLLVQKKTDLNWDGLVDVNTWFDDKGQMEKEQMDGDFDNRVDWVDHYRSGTKVMTEIDTNFDGATDTWKYYENGKIRRKERDSSGDGRADYWEYFDNDGSVIKTGQDVDGDGIMDIRDE